MHLAIVENEVVKLPAPPLSLVERRAVKNNVVRRFTANESGSAGYQFCAHCRKGIHIQNAVFCRPCEAMFASEAAEAALEAETHAMTKVFVIAMIIAAPIIALIVLLAKSGF